MTVLIENLERILATGEDNATLRLGLGKAYLDRQDTDAAIEHLGKALDHDPAFSAAWKFLGRAYSSAQRTDKAIEAYEKGIRIAEAKGDVQAAKEMQVFLRRLKPERTTH